MSDAQFEKEIRKLAKWYKKSLSDDQFDILFQRIGHIPIEALNDIVETLIDNKKYFPTPDEIKKEWYNWRRLNPDKSTDEVHDECPHCHGKGYLIYTPNTLGNKQYPGLYEYQARCGHCENWRNSCPKEMVMLTVDQAESGIIFGKPTNRAG